MEYRGKEIKIKRIIVIHKKNGGQSDARNVGITVATGKYIAFVDSDDYIDEQFLEQLYLAIKKNKSDISMCKYKKTYKLNEKNKKIYNKCIIYSPEEALRELLLFQNADNYIWNKLYKKSVIDGIMFPVGKKSEDYFVMYRYFDRAQKVVVLPEAKYHYIQRENSISRGKEITYDYIEGSKSQKNFIDQKHPEISYVGNTAYAFSYVATYNRCIKYKVQLYNKV